MAYKHRSKGYSKNVKQADQSLTSIINELWDADNNKCYTTEQYDVDLQGYTKKGCDRAKYDLFCYFNEEDVFSRKTYRTFRALLDNYTLQTGEQEVMTEEERIENRDFIDAIMETDVMNIAKDFLVKRGRAPEDLIAFKRMLFALWFRFYRRTKGDRDADSSSFEHVFVGECRVTRTEKKIIGMHNWIQFYLQEKKQNIDYKGYYGFKTDKADSTFRLLTLQFSMKGEEEEEDVEGVKSMSSMFLGSSPEFEIAVYTIMHLCGYHGTYKCKFGEYEVELECLPFNTCDGQYIGTAFIGFQDK